MAKTFYFDSAGLLESTLDDGTFSGTSFSSGTTITNEDRLIDQSLQTAASDIASGDALKITFASAKPLDFLAVYFSAQETDNLSLYREVATNTFSSVLDLTATFSAGWTVGEFSSSSATNWHLASTSGAVDNLTEIIVGKKLAFEVNPDVGIGEQEVFGVDLNTSIGGTEYAIKRHDSKSTFSFTFSNISQTFKEDLQSFEQAVQNFKKFIYSEDGTSGTFHYVRLDSPIKFSEVAFQRYSASFTIREQL